MRQGLAARHALAVGVAAAWAMAVALPPGARAAEPLKVCALEHNAPYSSRQSADGFDLATARAVGKKLGREIEVIWVANAARLSEIDDNDFPVRKLAKGECDALFSVPGPAGDSLREAPGLSLGKPYYGAAFELYGREGEQRGTLRQLRDATVANQAASVGAFALRLVGAKSRTHFEPGTALDSVAKGEAELALLWGPAAEPVLKAGGIAGVARVASYTPPPALSWNEHVATRTMDESLRTTLDAALATLAADGTLARLAETHGLPWRAPFERTYSLGEMNSLR